MHELSVTQQILDIASTKASEVGATTIKRINLVIGDMSSIIDDSVQFYFGILSKDSVAKGAELSFRRIQVTIRCRNCGHEFTPANDSWNCPHCDQCEIDVISGNEFYVDSIEVE